MPLSTRPLTSVAMVTGHQLGDRAAHRVADDDRLLDPERPQHRGGVIGAVGQPEGRQRAQPARVAAVVEGQHAVAGIGERTVGGVPVEVGAHHPAVQQQDGGAVAAGVAQEELAAVRAPGRCAPAASRAAGSVGTRAYGPSRRMLLRACGRIRVLPSHDMAVVIASDLKKDIAGEPLLAGVSFKLERRDRMTLSGRNGAGKTTLLRMLAGEASVDGGELVFGKGAKVALHDQRPPRDRDISLRDYILSGARELVAIEAELAALEQAMASGAHDEATLDRYADAQARLEHAGGYNWRDRALATLHGLGLSRRRRPGPRRWPRSPAAS